MQIGKRAAIVICAYFDVTFVQLKIYIYIICTDVHIEPSRFVDQSYNTQSRFNYTSVQRECSRVNKCQIENVSRNAYQMAV